MLLILAGSNDREARAAVAHLNRGSGPRRAALLTSMDLSLEGWELHATQPGSGCVMAEGRAVRVQDISGVWVRRLAVYPQELEHVHAQDRAYVASEMTALLAWWLTVLPVAVVNRPAGGVLCGPAWRPEQWRAMACQLGFHALRARKQSSAPSILPRLAYEVVVVGSRAIGNGTPQMADCAIALAQSAKIGLLYAAFDSSGALATAHVLPCASLPVADAIAQFTEGEYDRCSPVALPSVNDPARDAAPILVVGASQ